MFIKIFPSLSVIIAEPIKNSQKSPKIKIFNISKLDKQFMMKPCWDNYEKRFHRRLRGYVHGLLTMFKRKNVPESKNIGNEANGWRFDSQEAEFRAECCGVD